MLLFYVALASTLVCGCFNVVFLIVLFRAIHRQLTPGFLDEVRDVLFEHMDLVLRNSMPAPLKRVLFGADDVPKLSFIQRTKKMT